MKALVLGGGVVGVTTAYYLAREGVTVKVVEREARLGGDATGGNAGLIAPGNAFAWASPDAPRMLLASLRPGARTPIRVRPRLDPQLMAWGLRFLRECTAARAEANTLAKLALCRYSQHELDELADEESIDYQQLHRGAAYLYRTRRELETGIERMNLLRRHGVETKVLDAAQVARLDSAFETVGGLFAGCVYVPSDASGNAELFTHELADRCRRLGVEFHLGVTVRALDANAREVTGVVTDRGILRADIYVLALGVHSPAVSRTAGVGLPIYPAKGYSLTAELADRDAAPWVGGVDESTLIAWSRMGDRIRMSSTAEFAGYDRSWRPSDFAHLITTGREMFGEAVRWETAALRSCLRPATPHGRPFLGRGRHRNLYYNTGHGHLGWTMACGSSRMLADLVLDRTPGLSPALFPVPIQLPGIR